jgi:UDP-N-acetylmuramoyl-tripeptide--D-alanyl-D-alanine ligase
MPPELVVPDTERALQDLGGWARQKWGGRVIGVTGSAGKTTTKDAIAHLLETELPTGKTSGNFNNHVGVPLSLLRLPDGCRAGVIEMGMNHAGEIRRLAEIAKPEIGVVTNVGYAHVEFFDSIEGIAAAKRELIEGLPPDGIAVLNADDSRVSRFREVHPGRSITFGFSEGADVRAVNVEFGSAGSRFQALGVDFENAMSGRHAVMNLLAAIAVAHVFEIPAGRLRAAVASSTAGDMRGQRTVHQGIVIWNDCYNSNPEAAQSMLDVLRETPAVRRIAVLGEMLELGSAAEELHRQVGRYAAGRGVDLLIGVHGAARAMVEAATRAGVEAQFFEDPAEAGDCVRRVARSGDAVLFKGSRGIKVEKALERFTA